jgi:imidazole glycerol-phosphate synthase subunit HisH
MTGAKAMTAGSSGSAAVRPPGGTAARETSARRRLPLGEASAGRSGSTAARQLGGLAGSQKSARRKLPIRTTTAADNGSTAAEQPSGLAARETNPRRRLRAGKPNAAGARANAGTGPVDAGTAPARQAVVVDTGIGNLGNVERALVHLGAAATVTADPAQVAAARCLVLPGVGAFAPPREALRGALEAALAAALADGAWLLGICVGYQLLFEASDEWRVTDGLGLLPGRVTRLPAVVPVPHIGWNRLHDLAAHPLLAGLGRPRRAGTAEEAVELPAGSAFAARGPSQVGGPVEPDGIPDADCARPFAALAGGAYVYFVHSYAPEDVPDEVCLARATHGRGFAAVAGRGRVLGTQFHPERSGAAGLRLLANFLEIAHGAVAGD